MVRRITMSTAASTLIFRTVTGNTVTGGHAVAPATGYYLAGSFNVPRAISIRNISATATATHIIYIGGKTVTTSIGYPLYPHDSLAFNVVGNEAIYGIAAGAYVLSVLVINPT